MKIAVGSYYAKKKKKKRLLPYLESRYEVTDQGSYDPAPVDFPRISRKVCDAVLRGEADRGVMFCGTGVGAAIACNKVPGIRASVCHDLYTAHQCVEHDDVQVIALGAQIIGYTAAQELIDIFLSAQFSGGEDFRRRVHMLEEMDGAR